MSMIKGLIKKDLYNLASYKTSIIITIIFVCGLGICSSNTTNYIPIAISTIIGMIVLSTFNYDEIAKANKYILALPTNKKELVKAKYILAIIATIVSGILGIVLTIVIINIIKYINTENAININYNELINISLCGIFGVSLIQAIQIPSMYKWGAEKGRIQMLIVVVALVAIIIGIVFLMSKSNINVNLDMIKKCLDKYGLPLMILFVSIIYYVSYKISCNIYENQEN